MTMKKAKKKIILAVLIVFAIVSLIPVPMRYKDGGSVKYRALLYSVTVYHVLSMDEEDGYKDGIGIEVLGIKVYDNVYG